jgi:hypothetical protein
MLSGEGHTMQLQKGKRKDKQWFLNHYIKAKYCVYEPH